MEINGVAGDVQGLGHLIDGTFQLENVPVVEQADNLLVAHGGKNRSIGEDGVFCLRQLLGDGIRGIFSEVLRRKYGAGLGKDTGDEIQNRGSEVEIDAEQADDPAMLPADGDGGGFHGLSVVIFAEIHPMIRFTLLLLQLFQHAQGQIRNGGAFRAACMEAVHDLDHGVIQVFQTVQRDFVAGAKISGQALYNRNIAVQNQPFLFDKRNLFYHITPIL